MTDQYIKGTQTDRPIAPSGQVFICGACGKRSRDIYGDQAIDQGWDSSCFINSHLMPEDEAQRLHEQMRPNRPSLT